MVHSNLFLRFQIYNLAKIANRFGIHWSGTATMCISHRKLVKNTEKKNEYLILHFMVHFLIIIYCRDLYGIIVKYASFKSIYTNITWYMKHRTTQGKAPRKRILGKHVRDFFYINVKTNHEFISKCLFFFCMMNSLLYVETFKNHWQNHASKNMIPK